MFLLLVYYILIGNTMDSAMRGAYYKKLENGTTIVETHEGAVEWGGKRVKLLTGVE